MSAALILAGIFFIAALLIFVIALCMAVAKGDRQIRHMARPDRERVGWRPAGSELLNANKRAGSVQPPRPTTKRS